MTKLFVGQHRRHRFCPANDKFGEYERGEQFSLDSEKWRPSNGGTGKYGMGCWPRISTASYRFQAANKQTFVSLMCRLEGQTKL